MAYPNNRIQSWKERIKHLHHRRGPSAHNPPVYPPVPAESIESRQLVPAVLASRRISQNQYSNQNQSRRSTILIRTDLDSNWINLETLRLWLRACDSQHGYHCIQATFATGYPQWLVDVQRLCIVRAKSPDRYVALSYVWGQVECSKAMKCNLEELQKPESLSEKNSNVIIPRTIRHAIRLVTLIGEQLLWVDSLCIVQDDAASKHSQLNEMASIYANAYVTLIAANGWDANHGFRGIKGVTEPREISPLGLDVYESLQPYSTIWYSRGWTFQELLFSPKDYVPVSNGNLGVSLQRVARGSSYSGKHTRY